MGPSRVKSLEVARLNVESGGVGSGKTPLLQRSNNYKRMLNGRFGIE